MALTLAQYHRVAARWQCQSTIRIRIRITIVVVAVVVVAVVVVVVVVATRLKSHVGGLRNIRLEK
jgi:hypothetical protein